MQQPNVSFVLRPTDLAGIDIQVDRVGRESGIQSSRATNISWKLFSSDRLGLSAFPLSTLMFLLIIAPEFLTHYHPNLLRVCTDLNLRFYVASCATSLHRNRAGGAQPGLSSSNQDEATRVWGCEQGKAAIRIRHFFFGARLSAKKEIAKQDGPSK